jgi:hypothetical protein
LEEPQRQKVIDMPSQQTSRVWWYKSVTSATWEAEIGGSKFQTGLGQKLETLSEK